MEDFHTTWNTILLEILFLFIYLRMFPKKKSNLNLLSLKILELAYKIPPRERLQLCLSLCTIIKLTLLFAFSVSAFNLI